MKEEEGIIFSDTSGQSLLDEARFIRQVRWRSTIRIILLSLLVLMVGFTALFVGTRILLNNQQNRISSYYSELVRFSEPNTVALPGSWQDTGWFGRQMQYHIIRIVGKRPVPVGTVTINFQIWGGERVMSNANSMAIIDNKEYLTPNMVPALMFYHPAGVPVKAYEHANPRDFDALENMSSDSTVTVEMALSFNRLLTKRELEEMLPDRVEPLWGAIATYSDEDIRKHPGLANRLVGVPLGKLLESGGYIQEADFPEALKSLSQIPSYSSKLLARTSVYLKNNGIRYYGVVVAGNPKSLLGLKDNPIISGAVKGITIRADE